MAVRSPKGKIWEDKLQGMMRDGGRNLEEGAVTEAYKGNKEEVIQLLDRALASEWTAFLQYYHHYFMATDIHSAEIKEYFKEAAAQELHHIEEIGERIQLLGGVPTHKPQDIAELWPGGVEYGHDLLSMLEVDLVAERSTINFYSEIVRVTGFDDIVTRVLFEEILREEQDHANELSDLLFAADASTNEIIPTMHQQEVDEKGSRHRKVA